MSYEYEEIRQSQEMFTFLLQNHELGEEDSPALFKIFVESDSVQRLVRSQAETAQCQVERYGDVIYLIPDENNVFLSFSRAELKRKLCRYNGSERDYFLAQFVVLTLLLEFYDGQGASSKTRDYIRVGELQNAVSDNLEEGKRLSGEEQEEAGLSFGAMLEAYEALLSDDGGKKKKTSKEGFLHGILRFLQEQGLIEYVEADEMVKTTKKLDHFMDWNILNKKNYERVRRVLGEKADE